MFFVGAIKATNEFAYVLTVEGKLNNARVVKLCGFDECEEVFVEGQKRLLALRSKLNVFAVGSSRRFLPPS
jgi:hypothetical protein